MDTLALLREEAGVHALVVERLDQLPLHPADHGGGETPGAADGFAVFVEVRCVVGMELDDVPRTDPVVVDVPLHRRCEVMDDDPDLHRRREHRLAHRATLADRFVLGDCKPSDGLEPSTPSLPWRFRGVTRVHVRSLATQFLLQLSLFEGPEMRRETSRVSFLMCLFCVRLLLTHRTTAPARRS